MIVVVSLINFLYLKYLKELFDCFFFIKLNKISFLFKVYSKL